MQEQTTTRKLSMVQNMAERYFSLFRNCSKPIFRSSVHRIVRISRSFTSNGDLNLVKTLVHNCRPNFVDFWFRAFRVGGVDSTFRPCAFSDPRIHVVPYVLHSDKHGKEINVYTSDLSEVSESRSFYVNLESLFSWGLEEIFRSGSVPSLSTLEEFLRSREKHENCLDGLYNGLEYTETEVAIQLIHHLLQPLNGGSYHLSRDMKNVKNRCPCSNKECNKIAIYDDTNFGSPFLWFGRVDAFLYSDIGGYQPIKMEMAKELRLEDGQDTSQVQFFEFVANHFTIRTYKKESQVFAQAMTNSLYQEKIQEQKDVGPITTLIPTICLSDRFFDIYLYDPKNDILLRNHSVFPIFKTQSSEAEFDLNSVLLLWMSLNYALLKPKFSSNQLAILQGSCGLKKQLENLGLMKKIKDTLTINQRISAPKEQKATKFEAVL